MKDKKFVKLIVVYLIGLIMVVYSLLLIGYTIGYQQGREQGFDACIEENNLYDRY